ncbi:MAG: hypothetical protein AW07_02877 [Candidatus Accumulibacter sp. SK-11]|nr:MAG: hypothetical protein AW07_02877 [Candidatus Accumulibacter sp. SK-11]
MTDGHLRLDGDFTIRVLFEVAHAKHLPRTLCQPPDALVERRSELLENRSSLRPWCRIGRIGLQPFLVAVIARQLDLLAPLHEVPRHVAHGLGEVRVKRAFAPP